MFYKCTFPQDVLLVMCTFGPKSVSFLDPILVSFWDPILGHFWDPCADTPFTPICLYI